MNQHWEQLQQLFWEACDLDEAARRAFLKERCARDEPLRGELERLLAGHDRERAAGAQADARAAPERFGAWQTTRLLARGGMGEVWLAHRADGQHEQIAALKILSPYLAAPDSVDRFRRERQLLARLEHPNIARLLDGGVGPGGEPFLVMEYVEGVRLDRYCDDHRLPIPARLRLFLKICAAVNAAHQHFVVHRDLKPSNILVTKQGEPKLLDFGIAKVMDAETGREQTATVNQFLTPTFASPEVLRGEPAAAASDVYALGVLLYDLLTGNRPFGASGAFPAAEWERALRDTAPARPWPVSEAIAERRATTAARLRQTIEGDLTTIVDKALRYEPGQRYQSAEHLAEDLSLYLANRPILARPQTLRYRARKFVARHRWPVGVGAVMLLGIVLGVASTVAEKRVAERRFGEVRQLAHYVLFDLYDDVSNLSGSAEVRAEMAHRATEYLNTLSREAKSDRSLRLELADGYLRLGDIQGNMFRTNLGDTRAALTTYQRGIDLLTPLANDRDAVRLRTLIDLHRAQATDMNSATRNDFDRLHGGVERFEKLAGNPPGIEDDYQLGQAYTLLGGLEQQHGGWVSLSAAGVSEFDRAEAHLRRAAGSPLSEPDYAYALAELLDRRAQSYASLDPQRSIAYDRQALEVLTRVREPERNYPSFRILQARVHSNLTFTYGQMNQFATALEHAQAAEQIYLPLAAASPKDHNVRYRLVVLRRVTGIVDGYARRWDEAAEEFVKGIADYDILLETGPNAQYRGYQAELRMRLGDVLWEAGRKREAETAAAAGLGEFRELVNASGATFGVLRQAAHFLLMTEVTVLRNPQEALSLAERSRGVASDPFQLHELLAAAYAENHRYREAAQYERKALSELPPVKPGEPPSRARQSNEANLAEYERKAKPARP